MTRIRSAFTLIDLLVVLTALVTLVALTTVALSSVALGGNGVRTKTTRLKDAVHAKQIHQAFVVYSHEIEGRLPRPGLIDRLPIEVAGVMRDIPGRGPEDITQNTTANLYAALIMQNYFPPEVVVSPAERNPRVAVAKDYDYEAYDPMGDVYWDPAFTADLETGSSASYAHLVMFGARMEREWRATMNANYPAIANRGPVDGEPDHTSHTCGPHGHWAGNVVFNDNHTEMLDRMSLERLPLPDAAAAAPGTDGLRVPRPDNLFAIETGAAGADAIISFTKAMTDTGPVLQHD